LTSGLPTGLRLFDAKARSDRTKARAQESTYAFLDRSGDPAFTRVRDALEEWFSRWPRAEQPELRRRMGKGGRDFTGGFFELYLHELHLRLGYDVEVHPVVPNGRRPDFLVAREGRTHYVEATVCGSRSDPGGSARRARIVDSIDQIDGNGFGLLMEIKEEGQASPSVRDLKRQLEAWLATLDAVAERAAQTRRSDLDCLPLYRWVRGDWRLEFRAWPLSGDRRIRGAILTQPGDGGVFDDAATIRNAVEYKAKRYGTLNHPLVLAVHVDLLTTDTDDIRAALFGPRITRLAADGTIDSRPSERGTGLWHRDGQARNLHIPSVLTWDVELRPWSVTRRRPRIWHSPGNETFAPIPAFDPATVFRLARGANWPGQAFRDS
jgi:hypothetical protein